MPAMPPPIRYKTGIMYIAGKAQHCKRHTIRQNHARHAYSDHAHKASPIIDTTHPIIVGTGFKAKKFWAKKNRPPCQKAQRAEYFMICNQKP